MKSSVSTSLSPEMSCDRDSDGVNPLKMGGDLEKGKKEIVVTNSADVAPRDWRRLFTATYDQTLQFFHQSI